MLSNVRGNVFFFQDRQDQEVSFGSFQHRNFYKLVSPRISLSGLLSAFFGQNEH